MKRHFLFLAAALLVSSCARVQYQSLSSNSNGKLLIISGNETGTGSGSQAVTLKCKQKSGKDYVCSKNYPAQSL